MIKRTIAALIVGAGAISVGAALAGPIGAGEVARPAPAVEPVYHHHFWYRHSFHRGPCWQVTFWGNYRYLCADSNRTVTHQY